MQNDEEQRSATEAAAYITGVGFGICRLGSHFVYLLFATIGFLVLMFCTDLPLVKTFLSYVALVVLIFGHALFQKLTA
jgi:hypothetical protein